MTFTEYLKEYLDRLLPSEREIYDRNARFYADENRRICLHRTWYTTNPPSCVSCGLVGDTN